MKLGFFFLLSSAPRLCQFCSILARSKAVCALLRGRDRNISAVPQHKRNGKVFYNNYRQGMA
jgi:hypothetical protein